MDWVILRWSPYHGLTNVRATAMCWLEWKQGRIKTDQKWCRFRFSFTGLQTRHNTVDLQLFFGRNSRQCRWCTFWGKLPYLHRAAVCFLNQETQYKSSPSPFGLYEVDRLTGKPIFIDISTSLWSWGSVVTEENLSADLPAQASLFLQHLVGKYYEQGANVFLIGHRRKTVTRGFASLSIIKR